MRDDMRSKEYSMGPYGRANVQETEESEMSRRQGDDGCSASKIIHSDLELT